MKVRTSLAAALLLGLAALAGPVAAADSCAGEPSSTRLTVQVKDIRAAQGEVAVTVYPDNARRFLVPKGKLARQRVKAQAPVTTTCFWLPGPGAYAVAVYHDANGDHDFNRSALGMPVEGFGFSNDAPARIGLPAFEAVRFQAPAKDNPIVIRMHYLK